MSAKLDLTGLELSGRVIGEASLTGRLEQREITLEARLPRFNVASNAVVGTKSPYPARFEIVADTDLSRLGIELARGEPLAGRATATVKELGEIARWQDVSASVFAESLLLKIRDREIRNQGPIDIAYENRRLVCRSVELISGSSGIRFSGSLPFDAAASPGVLSVTARMDLADLHGLIPAENDVSATGTLTLDAVLRGSLREIDPTVSLAMKDGSFDYHGLSVGLEHIGLDVQ